MKNANLNTHEVYWALTEAETGFNFSNSIVDNVDNGDIAGSCRPLFEE